MPCIQITTAKPISDAQEECLKSALGKVIEQLPKKSEKWLMCIFRSDASIWFQGIQSNAALVEIDVFGSLEKNTCASLTAELTKIIQTKLSIAPESLYIKYTSTPFWGWNGKNF